MSQSPIDLDLIEEEKVFADKSRKEEFSAYLEAKVAKRLGDKDMDSAYINEVLTAFPPYDLYPYFRTGAFQFYDRFAENNTEELRKAVISYNTFRQAKDLSNKEGTDIYSAINTIVNTGNIPLKAIVSFGDKTDWALYRNSLMSDKISTTDKLAVSTTTWGGAVVQLAKGTFGYKEDYFEREVLDPNTRYRHSGVVYSKDKPPAKLFQRSAIVASDFEPYSSSIPNKDLGYFFRVPKNDLSAFGTQSIKIKDEILQISNYESISPNSTKAIETFISRLGEGDVAVYVHITASGKKVANIIKPDGTGLSDALLESGVGVTEATGSIINVDTVKVATKPEPTEPSNPYSVAPSLLPINIVGWKGGKGPSPDDPSVKKVVGNNLVLAGTLRYPPYDGDTLSFVGGGSIRMLGIDAPEKAQLYGARAQEMLARLIKDQDIVIRVEGVDKYGRWLGVAYNANTGANINEYLLRNGYVHPYTDYVHDLPDDLADVFIDAAAEARATFSGDKAVGTIYEEGNIPPSEWRRLQNTADVPEGVMAVINGAPNAGMEFNEEILEYKTDPYISMESEYAHMSGKASIGHLSRLYDTYYSSADVKVWLLNDEGSQRVMVDLITGIGYSYSLNSMPVYTIGSRFPVFFTRGNGLGNGTLVVPFKHVKYLRAMLKYVFDEYDDGASRRAYNLIKAGEATDEEFVQKANSEILSSVDVVELGSIITPFDIEIRFDNSNAFNRDLGKSKLILKGCKFTGETMDVASTRDGVLQVGYNFLFKTVVTGDAHEHIS